MTYMPPNYYPIMERGTSLVEQLLGMGYRPDALSAPLRAAQSGQLALGPGGGGGALASQFLGLGNAGLGHQATSQALTQALAGSRMGGPMAALGQGQLAIGPGMGGGGLATQGGGMAALGQGARALGPGAATGGLPPGYFMGLNAQPDYMQPPGNFGPPPGGRAQRIVRPGAAAGGPGRIGAMGAAGAGNAAAGAGAAGRTLSGILGGLKAAPNKAMGLRGGLAGAAAYYLGNPLIEKVVPGEGGQTEGALKGALTGGAIGAGVGSVVPVVGTGVGAAIGAGAGALLSFLGGGKKGVKGVEDLKDAMADAGIDPQTGALILNRYQTTLSLAESDEEKRQAYTEAKNLVIDAVTNGGSMQQGPQQWTPEQVMAMQLQTTELLKPYAQQAQANAAQSAQLTGELTAGLPPGIRDLLRAGAAQELTATQRLSNAYMTQAALSPIGAQWQQQQQMQDQISNQLLQQALGQIINPTAGAGTDLTSLLTQMGQ